MKHKQLEPIVCWGMFLGTPFREFYVDDGPEMTFTHLRVGLLWKNMDSFKILEKDWDKIIVEQTL